MDSLREWATRGGAALAAAVFLALLASLYRVQSVPYWITAAAFGLVVMAATAPRWGLLAVAAMTPSIAWIGRHWNGYVAWPEVIVVAFCAGYSVRRVVTRTSPRDALDAPWLLVVTTVVGSLAVFYLVESWRFGVLATRAAMWQLATSDYFISPNNADPVDAAMRLLESLVLFRAAATLTRQFPGWGLQLMSSIVVGATAAAALNLSRVWEAAERAGTATAFIHLFLSERINVHYGDLNAAGSYFVMTLFVAVGLALRQRGWPWLASVVIIACSLWQSGSRAALVAGMLALLVPAGARLWRARSRAVRGATLAGAGLGLAVLAGVVAYAIPHRGNQTSAGTAAYVRWELARTSLRMTSSYPWFGVGIGRYYTRSGEFSSPELLASFPPAIHENAHNNFFQILAELGVVGFAAVLWLLGVASFYTWRLLVTDVDNPTRWCLASGAIAFVLSWLAGHPLLIDEPAFAFWLLIGALAGCGESVSPGSGVDRLRSWVVPAAIVLLATSVPIRADAQKADFNLEHRGIGVSTWRDAIDGVRYRIADPSSSVFVPGDARVVTLPLRAGPAQPELKVALRLDGRLADVIVVSRERWQWLRLNLPQDRNGPRFHRLDFVVENVPVGAENILLIGKVEPK